MASTPLRHHAIMPWHGTTRYHGPTFFARLIHVRVELLQGFQLFDQVLQMSVALQRWDQRPGETETGAVTPNLQARTVSENGGTTGNHREPCENNGKTWENNGKTMGKPWENVEKQ